MAKLKDIKGSAIQYLAEDPVEYVGTWSSGGNVNTGRAYGGSSGTSKDAAMYFGGYTTPTNYANTEQYNGTSQTEVNDLSNSRTGLAGFGNSLTSAVAFGGDEFPAPSPRYLADVEEWDGTNWTSGTNLPAATQQQNGAGTLTAGLAIGGDQPGSPNLTQTLEYDGTNWTSGGNLNTGKQFARVSCGLQTAALIAGAPGYSATTEQYNGTAWTEVNDLNTAGAQGGGGGTYTSAITSGNQNTASSNAESWDGTSWTETNNRSTDAYAVGGSGSSNQNAVVHHGYDSSPASFPTSTEEFSFPPTTASALSEGDMWFNYTSSVLKGYGTAAGIPTATWSSGANLNTVRDFHAMAATSSDAAIAFGGNPGSTANTEQYDGSSWTEKNNLNTGRNSLRGFGTVSAAIGAGGYAPTGTMNNVESWDGTNWTEVNEINSARQNPGRGGTQTAGILFGGYTTAKSAVTETWDGTSWTEVADMNTSGDYISSFGSQTSAIAGNRYQPGVSPGYTENVVESWNGTSWTETAEMNTARAEMSGEVGATGDLGLIAGGTPNGAGPAKIANTELWNGSSWTEVSDLGTARRNYGAGGPSASGILTGGDGDTDGTEEWTAPLTNKTITVS